METQAQSQGDPVVVKSNPYMSPMHNFGSSIVTMTNPDDELYKMELTFRSMYLDNKGGVHQAGDPLMNDLGINAVIGVVQSIVSRVTIMSNLSEDDVPKLIDFLGDTLARDLMVNRVNYGIKSFSARDKIYFSALSTAFVTMKRAFEEGEKRFWKGSQQEIISRVEGGQQKKGFLSGLMGWGK